MRAEKGRPARENRAAQQTDDGRSDTSVTPRPDKHARPSGGR